MEWNTNKSLEEDCVPEKMTEKSPTMKGRVQVLPVGLAIPRLRRTPEAPIDRPPHSVHPRPPPVCHKKPIPTPKQVVKLPDFQADTSRNKSLHVEDERDTKMEVKVGHPLDSSHPKTGHQFPKNPTTGTTKQPMKSEKSSRRANMPRDHAHWKSVDCRSSAPDPEKVFVDKFLNMTMGPKGVGFLNALEDIVQMRKPSTPPNVALFDTSWRSVDWSGYKNMKNNLRTLQIYTPEVEHLRILVHGPVGAGKSSFINSIDSIFQDRASYGAAVDSIDGKSCTQTLQTHYIRNRKSGSFLPFAICDIMGLENENSKGVQPGDIIKVLQGHIKDGYKFSETKAKRDPLYKKSPPLSEQIHCLVSVLQADAISIMDDALFDKMRRVRDEAVDLRIPRMAVLTKVDLICPEVAKDLKLIYRSKKIKEKMQECSNRLGVPMNCIFPVRNYNGESDLVDEVNVLVLDALKHFVDSAEDHVVKIVHSQAQNAKRKLK